MLSITDYKEQEGVQNLLIMIKVTYFLRILKILLDF